MKNFLRVLLVFCILLVSGCSTSSKQDTFTAGFIYNGSINDGGYNQAHDKGRIEAQKTLGINTIYNENVSEADFEKVAKNMIDLGAKVIFATSFEFMEPTLKLASQYPDVKFYHCAGYKTTDNMANYFGRMYEARYLAGMIAGLMTESNKIGFVGAFPIPEVISSINAFTLGAQSVNPNIEVEVAWSNTWFDPIAEKEAANTLISHGADVLAQHQNTTAVQQAANQAGIYSIGYNLDMSASASESNLTSNIWDWSKFYISAIEKVMNNTFEAKSYFDGMDTGLVKMADYNSIIDQKIIDQVNEKEAMIKDGSFNVFSGPITKQDGTIIENTLSDQEITSMDYFVKDVVTKID